MADGISNRPPTLGSAFTFVNVVPRQQGPRIAVSSHPPVVVPPSSANTGPAMTAFINVAPPR